MKTPTSPEHKRALAAWRLMRRRCLEPTFRDFPRYGGAGIQICPQWATFDQFLRDVGLPPTATSWLGRIDTASHYQAGNVRWTTREPQQNRRQFVRKVLLNGQAMSAAQAARVTGQPTRNTVLRRWNAGFALESTNKLKRLYRSSTWLTLGNETLPLPEWARRYGMPRVTLWRRIRAGMTLERALIRPIKKRAPRA
jgi:hypothetical protein